MAYQPLIVSPSANADFKEFQKSNPDLTDVFTWLQNKFKIENYLQVKMEYFGMEEITDYIKSKRWKPDDIFSMDDLAEWADENDFVKDDWENL